MSEASSADRPHRLPDVVRPQRYDLHLAVDPARADFDGEVTIHAEAAQGTASFQVHAQGLDIHAVTVEQEGAADAAFTLDGDRLTITPAEPLQAGPLAIRIRYTGVVRHDMAGLYLSKDGDRACLATQCEATDARSIVPCWDEPAHKATWHWTITAPEGLTVLANGPVAATATEDGHTTHEFAPVGPMSSYLIACCIGDFAATEAIDARGHAMRVWAMQGQEQHGDIGNELAARMLPWYEDYFGQPYAFGKYDQIAVPSFAFGAMENAGLVLFRPSLLLMDPDTASWDDHRHVALVVAHEFAHMWFGNLVTMAWWDDLWLNEAFAEWIAHKCADAMDPDLDVWVPFRQRAAGALTTDALTSTHAIYHPVQTPEEAQEMFDAITYGKGSAVMRMLESYLGEDAFRKGLQSYMAAFRFDNAHGKDLWHHLGEASGQDVAGIMGDWVKQAGHPTVACAWDGRLTLRQYRTRSSPDAGELPGHWRVPMVIRYEDDAGTHEHRYLLSDAEATIDLPVEGGLKWLWPNAHDGGFYRSRLDEDLLHRAVQADLAPPERVALLRDLWIQVRAGDRDVRSFLDTFAASLTGTGHYELVEFQVALARMVDGLLHGQGGQTSYRAWLADALRSAWADAPADSPADRQRRAALLRAIGGISQDAEVAEAARRIASAERDGDVDDPQLATMAVMVEAATGDRAMLDVHLATYEARRSGDASPQEVERYVYALPQYRDPDAVQHILGLLRNGGVAAQAEGPILRAMLTEPAGQEAAWSHLQQHWDATMERLGEAWLGIIVEACGELPTRLADDIKAFLDARLDGHAAQSYARAKERLRERAGLEQRIGDDLVAWAEGLTATA